MAMAIASDYHQWLKHLGKREHQGFSIITIKGILFYVTVSIVAVGHNSFHTIARGLTMIVDAVIKILNVKGGKPHKDGSNYVAVQDQGYIRGAVTHFVAALMDVAFIYLVKGYK